MNKTQANELKLLLARISEFLKTADVRTKRETRIEAGLLTQQETAKRLGVSPHTLAKEIAEGRVEAPARKAAGGKVSCYSPDDVEKLKSYFDSRPRGSASFTARRRADGFYSRAEVAARVGIRGNISITHHERAGRIRPPTRRYPGAPGGAVYYSEGEAKAVEKVLRERKGFAGGGRRGPRAKVSRGRASRKNQKGL